MRGEGPLARGEAPLARGGFPGTAGRLPRHAGRLPERMGRLPERMGKLPERMGKLPVCMGKRRVGAQAPIPWIFSGAIFTSTRTSPGLFQGYLSCPMYFFASRSMPSSPPLSVTSTTFPRISTYS